MMNIDYMWIEPLNLSFFHALLDETNRINTDYVVTLDLDKTYLMGGEL